MEFKWLLLDAGLKTDEDTAEFFKVSPRTVKNWKKEKPPHAVFLCLQLMNGKLDGLGENWKGFKLTTETIESPEGDFIYSYEVRSIRYVYQAAGINRTRICNMLRNQTPITKKDHYHKQVIPSPKRQSTCKIITLSTKRKKRLNND